MKLLLTGHEERYAIEQLQLSLFPGEHMEPELCIRDSLWPGALRPCARPSGLACRA